MPFGVVSGVSREMGVIDGSPYATREGEVLGGFFVPTGLNGIYFEQKCI